MNINLTVVEPTYRVDNYALERKYRLQVAHKEARDLKDKMQ